MATSPVLVVHGGAGSRSLEGERYLAYRESILRIVEDAGRKLLRGGSALSAVVRAVELLEDDPLYNAGRGSKIQSDGKIRMSASLMDGKGRRFSGCVNVEGVKNPIRLAEALLDQPDRVLSEAGAKRFAKKAGLEFASPFTTRARADYQARLQGKTGTVGAVALDAKGRLAAATSTGGRGFEYPHRVSDTPTIAANFADLKSAVSATGVGEEIVEHAVAAGLCALVSQGVPLDRASRELLARAKKSRAGFGWIALDAKGKMSAVTSTETLIWASIDARGVAVFKEGRKVPSSKRR